MLHATWFVTGVAVLAMTGCGRRGFDAEQAVTFVDDDQAAFERGSSASSTVAGWRADRLQIASSPPYPLGDTAVFVSRPLITGDESTRWTSLSWIPAAPYGVPLVGNGDSETGYVEDTVSMADNILLLHLEGSGAPAHQARVIDDSGRGHDGEVVLVGAVATHITGAIGQGLDLEKGAYVSVDGSSLDHGTGEFTWSIWAKLQPCGSGDNRIAMGGAGAGDSPHLWIGGSCPDPCPGLDNAQLYFFDSNRLGGSAQACSGVVLADGAWHLISMVKERHTAPPALFRLYVDGREVDVATFDAGANTFTYDGGELRLGSFNLSDPTYHTPISVDEAAIWNRALSALEIAAIHRRGALELGLQFRVCIDGECDDESFVGPDGTVDTYFAAADLAGSANESPGNLESLGLVGPVAQYRVRLRTRAPLASPGVFAVRIDARR